MRWRSDRGVRLEVARVIAAVTLCAGCNSSSPPPPPDDPPHASAPTPSGSAKSAQPPIADLAPRAAGADTTRRLPEDPVAARRASRQWDEHLEHEETQRQLVFDRDRIAAHRKLIARLRAARAVLDEAPTVSALGRARAGMPARVAKIQEGVDALDPWGTGSRLLADYAALQSELLNRYPDAKQAALTGEPAALVEVRAEFDQRLGSMQRWLERARDAKGEGEEDAEEEERERRNESRMKAPAAPAPKP